jgi:ABC-2 type transport system ATP-binding protein
MEQILMPKLDAKDINFSYGTDNIFNSASLQAASHRITGLLGGNGSGKTTFFDILCGIRLPGSGSVHSEFKNTLYLSQLVTTPAVLSMRDIANMALALSRTRALKIDDLLVTLRGWNLYIADRYAALINKKSALCSYGEKRWFFTLTLLAMEPDLIILDEPTAGVDPEYRHYIWECLKAAASHGLAVLVSSHNIEEITEHCDEFYMISQHKFNRFETLAAYIEFYGADSLDGAFINAGKI